MRTANPVLNTSTLSRFYQTARIDQAMTVNGTINKTGVLLLCVMATAMWSWNQLITGQSVNGLILIGAFGGMIMAFVTVFKKQWSPVQPPFSWRMQPRCARICLPSCG